MSSSQRIRLRKEGFVRRFVIAMYVEKNWISQLTRVFIRGTLLIVSLILIILASTGVINVFRFWDSYKQWLPML